MVIFRCKALLLCLLFGVSVHAQNSKADSLLLLLDDDPSDERRISILIDIASFYLDSDLDSSKRFTDRDELLEAVRKVAGGGRYFSAEATLNLANNTGSSPENKDTELLAQLTEREIEILGLIAEGYSNKEIGERLFISHRTVDTHRTNLARKIDARNIAGLIRFAVRTGIVTS